MSNTSKNVFQDKTGYVYDKNELVIRDPEGNDWYFLNKEISNKMAKLYIQKRIAECEKKFDLAKKIQVKIDKLKIDESIYIYSTPAYCYTYVLYKIRKISGYSQEQMADLLYMPISTYIKIENRILELSLNNLTMVRAVFHLTAIELANLYNIVEEFILKNGILDFQPDLTDYFSNVDVNIKFKPAFEYSTPIDLYESKMIKEEFNIIDTKFREIVLEGQKRRIERDARNKEIEEEMARSAEYPQTLSAEEFSKYQHQQDHENWLYEQERDTAIQKRIELLKQFHGDKQFYSMGD